MKFFKTHGNVRLMVVVVLAFLSKFLFSFLPSFDVDMSTWLAWGSRIAEVGPANFYTDSVWTHYTPGYLYWLWFGGSLGLLNELFIKIPTILADIIVGLAIYFLVKKAWNSKLGLLSLVLYVLNPSLIFNGSVWGQIDGIFALFLFFAVYFLVEKKKILFSSLLWGAAFLIKPQALGLMPAILIILFKEFELKKIGLWFMVSLGVIALLSFPFFPNNPLGLFNLVATMAQDYSYTSLFAYNFWGIVGMWQKDSLTFLGASYDIWGILLYIGALILSFISCYPFKNKYQLYLFSSLSFFCFFLFPTRVHERYLFPALPFLLLGAFLGKNKALIYVFIILSLLHFANLYYPYAYYTPDSFLSSQLLRDVVGKFSVPISLGIISSFVAILFETKLPKTSFSTNIFSSDGFKERKEVLTFANSKKYLLIILFFSLLTRVVGLSNPDKFYFDEVYHAFTAQEIVRGNVQAWEFSATPPEGFAYEWTHPPLAKLFMAGSIYVFGDHPFSWRLPGALFGVGCIFLLYKLALKIFKDERVAILAAFLFSLDGLTLVMSRIGMNDIYFLFFILLAILLFLEDKYFFSSLSWGLALSSKWTAIFVLVIFIFAWILYKRKFAFKYLWFLIIPPLIYLGSYTIFFTTGHSLKDFWETQQQMWWYHTGLVATHPYSSPWWSWPLMLKPVWLYTFQENNWHSDIYIAGNPGIFFAGLISILFGVFMSFKVLRRGVLFVLICYACLFLPWSVSPRIMFLYHYTPAVPFLVLALAWVLSKLWDSKKYLFVKAYLILAFGLFIFYFPFWTGIGIPEAWWNFRF